MATQPLPLPDDKAKVSSEDAHIEGESAAVTHNKPFVIGGRGTSGGKESTKTILMIIIGVLVIGVAFLALISTKGSKRSKTDPSATGGTAGKPSLGRVEAAPAAPGALVPQDNIAAAQADNKTGVLEAKDIEKTKGNAAQGVGRTNDTSAGVKGVAPSSVPTSPSLRTGTAGANAKNLGDIPPFKQPTYNDGNTTQWTPPPYSGETGAAGLGNTNGGSSPQQQNSRLDDQYSRPSMVFVANEGNKVDKNGVQLPTEPDNFGLQSGYHVAARLESMASTALHAPVTAVIEYNYERDGQLLIPAGARAVGRITQADASGVMNITFDSLEMPGGRTTSISAIGATTSLQALKGNVTGKHAGRSFAIRSLAGMGSVAAMMVGQSSVNGAVSQGDLIRQRAADNIGMGADTEVMNLQTTEHIVVSVPAGTEMYLIFTKTQKVAPGAQQNIAVGRTQP